MSPTAIANIIQLVVAAAEEVPNLLAVIEEAVSASKAGAGPTNDQIAAAVLAAQANNAAIQGA